MADCRHRRGGPQPHAGRWAREEVIPPHHIYLKIAYHPSTEACAGPVSLPGRFEQELFEFQKSAVKIAACH